MPAYANAKGKVICFFQAADKFKSRYATFGFNEDAHLDDGATAKLPEVLAARSAVVMISSPLGTAIGGPLVAGLGATGTLVASGVATIALAAVASVLWTERGERAVDTQLRSVDAARSVHD